MERRERERENKKQEQERGKGKFMMKYRKNMRNEGKTKLNEHKNKSGY